MVDISGILGISILKKNNKYYIIFYDDHNNKKYCKQNINYISDLLYKLNKLNNSSFYIEDYQQNYYNTDYYIWDNDEAPHLNKFNKLIKNYKTCYKWNFTDIRLYIGSDIKDIINSLNYIFNLNNKYANKDLKKLKSFFTYNNNIKFVNYYFNKLKQKFITILNYKNKENKDLYKYFFKGYLVNNTQFNNIEYELELLIDNLMELYTLIILNNKSTKINIFYYGLLHSVNLVYYLKLSGCKLIYSSGITEENFKEKFDLQALQQNIQSCTKINIDEIKKYLE
tara:strand:- start:1473 stop:2318 length:846 start_codon:yes stop_codon:yes gene_type:complete